MSQRYVKIGFQGLYDDIQNPSIGFEQFAQTHDDNTPIVYSSGTTVTYLFEKKTE